MMTSWVMKIDNAGSLTFNQQPNAFIHFFLQDLAKSLGDEFLSDLASTGEKLLALFDSLLTMDDVETGRKYL